MKRFMIVDNRYAETARKSWGEMYEIIPSVTCQSLAEPVSAHPDMVLFKTGKREFICAPDVYEEYKRMLQPIGVDLICGKKELKSNYPEDIAYNILKTDSSAFGKFSETEETIKKYLEAENIKMINVKQGYSKCSVCSFAGGAITADESLYSALLADGQDTLKIPCGEIFLRGYDYGFIGGASGENDDGELFFFGDLKMLSFGEKIIRFLEEKKKKIHQISGITPIDVGTIMFID